MATTELNFPTVYEGDASAGYGGDQQWFPQKIQQMAGCASTCGANLASYYAANFPQLAQLYRGGTRRFQKEEYLACMENMYKFMPPGVMGFPYMNRFIKQFTLYAKEHGGNVKAIACDKTDDWRQTYNFVKESIDERHPVALLILRHRSAELLDDNWHWVTITGCIEEDDGTPHVIFSDCGSRDIHSAEVLFEAHHGNVLRLVRFAC